MARGDPRNPVPPTALPRWMTSHDPFQGAWGVNAGVRNGASRELKKSEYLTCTPLVVVLEMISGMRENYGFRWRGKKHIVAAASSLTTRGEIMPRATVRRSATNGEV